MESLTLFHKMTCPYSKKVRDYIETHHLERQITYRDTSKDPAAEQELKSLTQDRQVPCLVIDGKPLLESDAIVSWLSQHRVKAG